MSTITQIVLPCVAPPLDSRGWTPLGQSHYPTRRPLRFAIGLSSRAETVHQTGWSQTWIRLAPNGNGHRQARSSQCDGSRSRASAGKPRLSRLGTKEHPATTARLNRAGFYLWFRPLLQRRERRLKSHAFQATRRIIRRSEMPPTRQSRLSRGPIDQAANPTRRGPGRCWRSPRLDHRGDVRRSEFRTRDR